MTFQNYFYNIEEPGNYKSYEELLLLDYDNYVDNGSMNDFLQNKESDIFKNAKEEMELF